MLACRNAVPPCRVAHRAPAERDARASFTTIGSCKYFEIGNTFDCSEADPPLSQVPNYIPEATFMLKLQGNNIHTITATDFADLHNLYKL
jgi:hypothetical protein